MGAWVMVILMLIGCMIASALFYVYYTYFNHYLLLYMPSAVTLTALVIYPLSGEGNFINRIFLLTMISVLSVVVILYSNQLLHLSIKKPFELLVITVFICMLIPLLFATSSASIFIASAYLSVSVFIAGYILFTLGIIDQQDPDSPYSIYRLMKHPVRIGLLLMYSIVILLTIFMPYNYLYGLWFILFCLYILRSESLS